MVLACLMVSSVCRAQIGRIYFDDFNGTGPLAGTAPDVRPGEETWLASTVFGADGSVSQSRGASGYTYQALLPFVPDDGKVYVLSMDMNPDSYTEDASNWFGLGFIDRDTIDGGQWWDHAVAWIMQRVNRNYNNDEMETFLGPGVAGSATHQSREAGFVTLGVILDTTQEQWTVSWMRNGQIIRGPVAYTANPTINYVGFTKVWMIGGAVDNFELKISDDTAPLPSRPQPADTADDVRLDATLSWEPGIGAVAHDVYLGTVLDDVDNASRDNPLGALVSLNQDPNTFDLSDIVDYGRTYYWRIDEIDAVGSVAKGRIWSFTVEPYSIPIVGVTATASSSEPGLGPELTVDGSGLTDDKHSTAAPAMWQSQVGAAGPVWIQYAFDRAYELDALKVWNYNGSLEFIVGFGLKDVTVEYSVDGVNWTVLGDFVFAQGPSAAGYAANTTVDFSGVTARYVRLVVNSSWGSVDRHGLSEVRFLYVPTYPRQPDPASGATGLGPDVVLSWRAGRAATSHGIYVSPDEAAVASGVALVDTVAENRYELSGLDLGTTYYWKIEEINEASASWVGEVWDFTTRESYAVEDFESYNDDEDAGTTVWQTWLDGVGTNHNGGQAGHNLPPYSEGTVVHSGRQSLPFYYSNSGSITRSEAVRTFATPQNWTRSGIRFLVVYFRGQAENTVGQMYVKINETQVIYAGVASDLTKAFWVPWIIDLSTVGANLASVRSLTLGIENSGSGMVYFDDIRLYRLAPALATAEVWFEAEAADSVRWPMQVYSDREDASGGQYIATFGTNSTGNPPDNGIASYPVKLAGGTYRIIGRVIAPTGNDDSFWVRLQGATTNTANHVSGWVQWGLDVGDDWHEVPVRSVDDDNATVLFTVEPGIYNLQIAFREDGALLDNWVITKELQ
jgi:hypothetical protein